MFVANTDSRPQLWLYWIDSGVSPQLLKGTDNGRFPFWSPDSQSIAFAASGQLKRLDLEGGAVRHNAHSENGPSVPVRLHNITPPLSEVKMTRVFSPRRRFFQRIEHAAHDGIRLHDEVGIRIQAALPLPLRYTASGVCGAVSGR